MTTIDGVVTLSGEVDSQASIAGGVENVESVGTELLMKAAE